MSQKPNSFFDAAAYRNNTAGIKNAASGNGIGRQNADPVYAKAIGQACPAQNISKNRITDPSASGTMGIPAFVPAEPNGTYPRFDGAMPYMTNSSAYDPYLNRAAVYSKCSVK